MPKGGHPKIILCSTNNEIEQIMIALEQGADEYIMKPFDQDIVRSKFEQTGLM
jgi:two-component system chemotaxis response regulator CheY